MTIFSRTTPVLLRRVHGRYAHYYNSCCRRIGHRWQNRFVERNPMRAGMVARAEDYARSSAPAHLSGEDPIRCWIWIGGEERPLSIGDGC